MNRGTIFLTLTTLILACSSKPYSTGDKLFNKKYYAEALLSYQKSLKRADLNRQDRNILLYKLGKTFYMMGDRQKALETLREVPYLASPLACQFLNLKIKIMNELGVHKPDSESAELLESFDNEGCQADSPDLDLFYETMYKLYPSIKSKPCQRQLLKGHLRKDNGDALAASRHYKEALKCNPNDEETLALLVQAFDEIENKLILKFDRNQKQRFYSHDYPLFFTFLSKLYSKRAGRQSDLPPGIKSQLELLTKKFTNLKVAIPTPVYSSLYFQNEESLVKTFDINERVKVFSIDRDDVKSRFIVYSQEDMAIGVSNWISKSNFMAPD